MIMQTRFLSRILLTNCKSLSVWDTYVADSLKESTRYKRGTGTRRKVLGQSSEVAPELDAVSSRFYKQDRAVSVSYRKGVTL